jgi:putative membrane protein
VVLAVAIAQWHVKKYSVVGGVLLVRSGVVDRSVRVVPITRITALAAFQSLTQRLLGVGS